MWWRRSKTVEAETTARGDMPLVRWEQITKTFSGGQGEPPVHALDHVTIDIRQGEYVSISGPSGCGKSTFLSVLGLLDAPTSGTYWLNGRRTDQLSNAERARARSVDIGLIFQSFNLIGDMTVYENIEYPLTLRGATPAERKAKVDAALARVGMTGRAKMRPGALSGGHQQLVAIARAFAGRPAMLLADEPTGNLDSKSGEAVMQMLDDLHTDGATVCLATHDPRHIARAERHIELFDGALKNCEL